MPIVRGDQIKSKKSFSDGVTKTFTLKKIPPDHKTPTFRMEFGLTVCLLERPPGAESILM